jgi:glycosyltransferase involved in cell wall biosynthesis
VKRTLVAFVIDLERNWLGGINYFRNLTTALYDDPDRSIDVVVVVGRRSDTAALAGFPPVAIVRSALLDRGTPAALLRKIVRKLAGRDVLLDRLLVHHRVDVLSHSDSLGPNAATRVASWIPDFQHLHLPAQFTAAEVRSRTAWVHGLCTTSDVIILSSENAQGDLINLFPSMRASSRVLRFVPHIDVNEALPDRAELEERYGFTGPYVYLPNQYWAHKNHRIVIEALGLLKAQGRSVLVLSTGSPSDYRNPDHYRGLVDRIGELGIADRYRALGVVPYRDLLGLMRHAACLVNPSLFEGWSTTVEEARAMDQLILLSDIPVHREQTPPRSRFFDPHDAAALADLLWEAGRGEAASNLAGAQPLDTGHAARRLAFSRTYHDIIRGVVHG